MKIALITGGSRGLGKNAALHAAKRGLGIVFTYHSNKRYCCAPSSICAESPWPGSWTCEQPPELKQPI